jgi:nicotinamide-nucleotide amidase
MLAEIIAVGSEMLTPFRQDTNSLYLTAGLNDLGIHVAFKTIVGDSIEHLTGAARNALARADLVVFSGGLGPTEDDLTREAAATALGIALHRDNDLVAALYKRFAERRIAMSANNIKQADVLDGATILPNKNGSAAGQFLVAEYQGTSRILVLLPGPPRELKPLFDTEVKPRLAAIVPPCFLARRQLRMALIPESQVDARTAPIYKLYPDVETTILAGSAEIQLHFQTVKPTLAEAQARVDELADRVARRGRAAHARHAPHDAGRGRILHRRSARPAPHRRPRQLSLLFGRCRRLLGRTQDQLRRCPARNHPARRPSLRARRPRPCRRHPPAYWSLHRRRHHRHRRTWCG